DAETGQRGYIITGQRSYLRPYNAAIKQVGARIAAIRRETAGDPVQQRSVRRLTSLAPRKLRELRRTVQLEAQGHHAMARQIVISGRGERLMNQIRTAIRAMQQEENRLLQRRTATAQTQSENAIDTIVTATLANLALLAFLFALVRRTIRRREMVSQERAEMLEREQQARRRIEELAAEREHFLSAVAHDLKAPLATVKGAAQLLRRRVERKGSIDTAHLLDGLQRIDNTATRMTALINEILDVTRLQMGEALELNRRPADLLALLRRQVADWQGTSQQHHISLETSVHELTGRWDVDRLDRAFSNLLSNAVKYSPDGGEVTVRVSVEAGGTEPRSRPVTWAVVSIDDQGLGIPADDLPHIFERFYRGRNVAGAISGTGIGLSGVRSIVEHHGGTVQAESREGAGSTFTVRLPVVPVEEDATPHPGGRPPGEMENAIPPAPAAPHPGGPGSPGPSR
ncbi:MAG: CHASE3 domain-containing protein, partial [Chloroflexi bacterium]|nr:CHASE3 domain-containing protein [Chloroflexota bacterium]